MSKMNLERVKDTIAKLLNLAQNDAATDGEVRNAMAFARKLMLEHQLSEDDCVQADESPEERVARAECAMHTTFSGSTNMASWEGQLAMFVCKFVGGVKVYKQSSVPRRVNGIVPSGKTPIATAFHFYGIDEDTAFARQTFDELSILIASMARLKWGGVFRGPGRSYAEAFVRGLFDQLEQTDAEVANSTSTALVVRRNDLVVAKEKRADLWLKETHNVKLTNGRRGTGGRHYHDAYSEGRADGRSASLAGRTAKLPGSQRLLQ